ncbi:unnamed protein product [Ectocarpus sp. 4 AP-2014]
MRVFDQLQCRRLFILGKLAQVLHILHLAVVGDELVDLDVDYAQCCYYSRKTLIHALASSNDTTPWPSLRKQSTSRVVYTLHAFPLPPDRSMVNTLYPFSIFASTTSPILPFLDVTVVPGTVSPDAPA